MTACRAFLVAGFVLLFFGFAAMAQQPETPATPPDFGKQLQEWQKIVEDVEKKTSVGPLAPEAINDMRERLKNIRAISTTASSSPATCASPSTPPSASTASKSRFPSATCTSSRPR